MSRYSDKLTLTAQHFANSDFNIGFRMLVDCVLDTANLDFYRKIIALTDWKESESYVENEFVARANELINELGQHQVDESESELPILEAIGLSKKYGRNKFSIGPVDLSISPGNVWGLVGENGNGKTTLLRILAKDLSFDKGELNYARANGKSLYDQRAELIYIPQRTPKWYGSLKNNLKFTATHYGITGEANELTVLMMIIRFGLWKFRNHQWSELSSGYKMRFELARTFLRKPKILLLDEPLANLDVLAQQLILEDLKSLAQSISNPIGIVLSSQQLFEVEKVASNVLFLRNGKPTRLNDANVEESPKTVIECDVVSSREELTKALAHLDLHDISFNGGMYLVTLNEPDQMPAILKAFVENGIRVNYVRDISKSTRRLFV